MPAWPWIVAAVVLIPGATVARGYFFPFERTGPAYLEKRLRKLGVPPNQMPARVKAKIVDLAKFSAQGLHTTRLAQIEEFRKTLDVSALQYAAWLANPEARIPGESSNKSAPSAIRRLFEGG